MFTIKMEKKFFFIFFCTIIFSFFAIQILLKIPIKQELFKKNISNQERGVLNNLTSYDLSKIKLHNAENKEKFDIAIFGNSRSVNIGKSDLQIRDEEFFNFSIPGESFRNSVSMIEILFNKNKVPKTNIIAFDNFEIDLIGGNVINPNLFFHRVKKKTIEFFYLINISYKEAFKNLHDYIIEEFRGLKYLFSITRNKIYVPLIFGYFYKDKVNLISENGKNIKTELLKKKKYKFDYIRNDKYLLLEKDLNTLKRVKEKTGVNIIIYISPILPDFQINQKLSSKAKFVKDRLFKICKKNKIRCIDSPMISNKKKPFWDDSSHPPSQKIGSWISKEILNAF